MTPKVIVRIRGGLGNQLFCYAAARRLALVNKAELVIDHVTGFARDYKYQRHYALEHFHIPVRKATPGERLEPFERYRRGVMKWLSRKTPFTERCYLEQEALDFDARLLTLKVRGVLYLDGLWQSERYFRDVEQTIRKDLRIIPPTDALSQRLADEIRNRNAVALHVRWFDLPGITSRHNVSADFYHRAIALMERNVELPQYFLFSDDPEAACAKLMLPRRAVTCVSHNRDNNRAYADLWLMQQCSHFIIPRSTFGWWGAWLSENTHKLILIPTFTPPNALRWNTQGMIFRNCEQL